MKKVILSEHHMQCVFSKDYLLITGTRTDLIAISNALDAIAYYAPTALSPTGLFETILASLQSGRYDEQVRLPQFKF